MDLNYIKDSVANLSLYDLKAGVRKVQNAVMNYTEMEAKLLNEIMPMIYKRFTEKAAEEWRQIYKALQLLEFLIKNGSERVIDDARGHLSLLKMLRQFQFIDQNGKDQGLNVRNRSKELAELLGDVDRIRAERKKARGNRNKFGGVEGGGGMSGGMSSGSRYGGFGSEDASYGGYSGGTYGDGGGFGGNSSSGFHDSGTSGATSGATSGSTGRRDRFEEYDEEDDGAISTPARRKPDTSTSSSAKRKPEAKKAPEVDLFSFGDEEIPPMTPPKSIPSNGKQAITSSTRNGNGAGDDDEFDEFISAAPTTQASSTSRSAIPGLPPPPSTSSMTSNTQYAAPKPVSATQGANLSDLVGFSSISPAPSNPTLTSTPGSTFSSPPLLSQPLYQQQQPQAQPLRPTGYQAAQPNYFTSVPAPSTGTPSASNSKPSLTSGNSFNTGKPGAKASSGGDAFGNLWSTASASAGIKKPTSGAQGPNLASMAKEKASQGMWGTTNSSTTSLGGAGQQRAGQAQGQKIGGGLDDLLG
ncbi:Epsin-3, clathrin recruitment and traffic between the Golgi and endosome [Xylographa bjoerkii]|nr:Epsin-3, clathrin recruitment and traffic between the Golgi and endosome [Xylographa bjoerkii]MCJ1396708.1 Epsin-3, clathrin recruitment and traffic between the Golgi and endosome [Xylographa bjoerkii]